jgi:hypothetical protein
MHPDIEVGEEDRIIIGMTTNRRLPYFLATMEALSLALHLNLTSDASHDLIHEVTNMYG